MNETPIVRRTLVINDKDPLGLHMRPGLALVKLALRYKCKIDIVREWDRETERETVRADAKSIFDLMTLVAEPGVEITLEAQGEDAEAAVEAIARFIDAGFPMDETKSQKKPQ